MRGASVLVRTGLSIALALGGAAATAHTSKPTKTTAKACAENLARPYEGKTVILDANVIMNNPNAIYSYPGGKIILTSTLLDELDNNKGEHHSKVSAQVRTFVRQLVYLIHEKQKAGKTTDLTTIELEDGIQVVLDPASYTRELGKMGFERNKADNYGYLAPALAYKNKGEDVILVTDDLMVEIKGASLGIAIESFKAKSEKLAPVAAEEGYQMVEITDEDMEKLLKENKLPPPASLKAAPNEFVQFFSPSYPVAQETMARYVFKRPEPILEQSSLTATQMAEGEFVLDEKPFVGTVRVSINNEVVPEIAAGESDGWYYDSAENKVILVGDLKKKLFDKTQVKIEGQVEAHEMKRLLSFDELGLWGLQSRSLEQTIAVNLALDLGTNLDCVIMYGMAGTSKTFNTVVAAEKLIEKHVFNKVIVTRSPTPMGGHTSGYLPGDQDDKNMPWMEPYMDNLAAVATARGVEPKKSKDLPAAWNIVDYGFMRGRSLAKTIVSVDEAQNMNALETEAVLTRISDGSAYLIMGDMSQVDPPMTYNNNGLSHLISLVTDPALTDEDLSRTAVIGLKKSVRHPFARMIAEAAQRRRQQGTQR